MAKLRKKAALTPGSECRPPGWPSAARARAAPPPQTPLRCGRSTRTACSLHRPSQSMNMKKNEKERETSYRKMWEFSPTMISGPGEEDVVATEPMARRLAMVPSKEKGEERERKIRNLRERTDSAPSPSAPTCGPPRQGQWGLHTKMHVVMKRREGETKPSPKTSSPSSQESTRSFISLSGRVTLKVPKSGYAGS